MNNVITIFWGIYLLAIISCTNIAKDESQLVDGFRQIEPEKKFWNFVGFDNNGYRFGEGNLVLVDKQVYPVTWNIYQNSNQFSTISLPDTWVVKQKDNVFLYAILGEQMKDIFVWKKYNKKDLNINLEQFISYYYDVCMADTIEVTEEIKISKYIFGEDQAGYYIASNMQKKSMSFKAHSFIIENGENIFEFTIKYLSNETNKVNKLLFDVIVDRVFVDGKNILEGVRQSEIIEIEFEEE